MSYSSSFYPKSQINQNKPPIYDMYDSDNDQDYNQKAEMLIQSQNSDNFIGEKTIKTMKSMKNESSINPSSTGNNIFEKNLKNLDDKTFKNSQSPSDQSDINTENLKTYNQLNKLNQQTNVSQSNQLIYLDSRKLKEPIINKSLFLKSLSKDIDNSEKLQLKLFEYPILKEIVEKCGSYPEKFRTYVWKFLLSLPNNKNLFDMYSIKGLHPFYRNLDLIFPLKDAKLFRKLQSMCSALTFWSPHVGNVYFLPNLIFPFIKCIKGDDLFLFELIISFINNYCQFWFEFYPGAPLNHFKLCEKIIESESPKIYSHFKKMEQENTQPNVFNYMSQKYENKEGRNLDPLVSSGSSYNSQNLTIKENIKLLNLSEVIWRMFKNNFSESLIKENWLQYMDFILTYNHKPEITLYFACAYLIKKQDLILKCKNFSDLENILFNSNYEKNSNINLLSVFTLTTKLLEKYSKYQLYIYKPHEPFYKGQLEENYSYPCIDKFPLDFLETTAKLREDIFKEEENFKQKQSQIDEIENKFKELSKKEEMMQRAYRSLVHREKEKGEIIKKELDLLMYQKMKFYEEMKHKKLDKVDRLNSLIQNSLKFYENMNTSELNHFEEEMRKRKILEEMDLKQRLQQEELNNLEFEANRKMINLLNLRNKDEEYRKFRTQDEILQKDREVNKRLLEEKWALEDEELKKKIENLRNLKEYELLKKKESTDLLHKEYTQKLNEFEQNLFIQQVERERKSRQIDGELELNKLLVENQNQVRSELLRLEEKNVIQNFTNKELELTKKRKKEQNEILLKKMNENLNLLNEEEKTLMQYEQELKNKEIENKLEEIRKRGEINAVQDQKFFQDQFMKFEELKRQHLLKKEEVEIKKKNLLSNINNVIEDMINNQSENFNEQNQNLKKISDIYGQETNNMINNMKSGNQPANNFQGSQNNFSQSQLSDYNYKMNMKDYQNTSGGNYANNQYLNSGTNSYGNYQGMGSFSQAGNNLYSSGSNTGNYNYGEKENLHSLNSLSLSAESR
jgi:hypothetical protein